jgi:hypothetical protein
VTDTIAFYHNPQARGRIVHWIPAIVLQADPAQHILLD